MTKFANSHPERKNNHNNSDDKINSVKILESSTKCINARTSIILIIKKDEQKKRTNLNKISIKQKAY